GIAVARRIRVPLLGYHLSTHDEPVRDVDFHLAVVVIAVGVILLPPMRQLIYLMFLSVDFTHSRITVAALGPLSALVAVLLASLANHRDFLATSRIRMALQVTGAALTAFVLVVAVDALAEQLPEAMPLLAG